ncbi:MAG TPA: VOC family protein [Candidatus Obscuribacterales bacterium]
MMVSMITHTILYVQDQQKSTDFYSSVLALQPSLNVPGMTEFQLAANCILGLMPETGIKKLLGSALPDPSSAHGIPRAEMYLVVDDCRTYYLRALGHGARPLSEPIKRDWGDVAGYCLDLDGHVLAFAERG